MQLACLAFDDQIRLPVQQFQRGVRRIVAIQARMADQGRPGRVRPTGQSRPCQAAEPAAGRPGRLAGRGRPAPAGLAGPAGPFY